MNLTLLIGGVILFIYSIDLLSNNLINISLDKVKQRLTKMTSSTSKSLITGFIATTIIQSSSAVIMLTITFINTNLLNFNSSIGIMLGSNIATTTTSFIIGLNLETISSYIMLIGTLLVNGKEKVKKIGKITFSIGLLFFSLYLMSLSINSLRESQTIYNYIQNVSSSFILSILVGSLITLTLQSSSVFIAILQILAMSNFITLYQAIPFIFGANIGTTFDSFYGILKAKKDSKKLAHFNLFFNIGTVILFSLFITPFNKLISFVTNLFSFNIAIDIAITNILFNFLGVILILPFLPQIKRYYSKW